jgi:hypothetical protein
VAICPHCKVDTIGYFAKGGSSATEPAKCKQCGGLSFIANTHGTAAGPALGLMPFVALFAFIFTGSSWVLAGTIAVVIWLVGYEVLAFHRTPMLPTTEAGVVEARGWQRVGLAIIAVIAGGIAIGVWIHRAA